MNVTIQGQGTHHGVHAMCMAGASRRAHKGYRFSADKLRFTPPLTNVKYNIAYHPDEWVLLHLWSRNFFRRSVFVPARVLPFMASRVAGYFC